MVVADGFVGDVLAVEQNAGGATGDAADRDGGVAGLGGIEAASGLEDDAGFDLGDVEEVTTIDGEAVDLGGGDNVGDAGLVGVDLEGTGGDFDGLRCGAEGELKASRRCRADLDGRIYFKNRETGGGNGHGVGAGVQGADAVKASFVGSQRFREAIIRVRDDDRGSDDLGTGGVGNLAFDRSAVCGDCLAEGCGGEDDARREGEAETNRHATEG